jgi:hypothetical protein
VLIFVDKSIVYITDKSESFFKGCYIINSFVVFSRIMQCYFCFVMIWSKIKGTSFQDYICSMNLCRIMIIDSVFLSHFLFPDMARSARKSMLGKRKNIPQPIPIQPQVSTVKHDLGVGKEQWRICNLYIYLYLYIPVVISFVMYIDVYNHTQYTLCYCSLSGC